MTCFITWSHTLGRISLPFLQTNDNCKYSFHSSTFPWKHQPATQYVLVKVWWFVGIPLFFQFLKSVMVFTDLWFPLTLHWNELIMLWATDVKWMLSWNQINELSLWKIKLLSSGINKHFHTTETAPQCNFHSGSAGRTDYIVQDDPLIMC